MVAAAHNFRDRTNQRVGKITILGPAPSRNRVHNGIRKRLTAWYAQCDCGEKFTLVGGNVDRTKQCLKCWYSRNEPKPGTRSGCMTLVSFHKKGENGRTYQHVKCKCDCGAERIMNFGHFKEHSTDTCGCRFERHGYASKKHKNTPEHALYRKWGNIKDRCLNENCKAFKHYGGRGIKLSDQWMNFENFLKDMGTAPKGCSLDRIDPDGPYSKENCRWADNRTQSRNRGFNKVYRFKGEELTLGQWVAKIQMEGELVSMPDIGASTNVDDY